MSRITASALTILFFVSLSANAQYKKSTSKDYITDVKEITDIMVFDVTSPVAAARYYAYSNLAAYEVMSTRGLVKRFKFFFLLTVYIGSTFKFRIY